MKKTIRLTESDLARLIKRMIKENEQDWIDQAQDMDTESDFSKMEKLEQNEDFQDLVSFFQENPEIAQEIKNSMENNVSEAYKYYDYGDGKKEITRNQYLKRKLINYGIWGTLGAIVGYMMGTMAGDDVLQAALLMAGLGGTVGAELSASSGRERIKEQDEELGQTDKGEETLQDLIEEARDILENECGYSIEEINSMDERDIVEFLSNEGYEDLASEIEYLLDQEGFDKEQDEDDYDFDSLSNQYYGKLLDLQDRYDNSECDELDDVLNDLNDLIYEIDKSGDLKEWEKNTVINQLDDLSIEIEHTIEFECNNGGYEDKEEFNENWDTEFEKRHFNKYDRKDYRDVPKNPFKHTSLLDFEGTRLSKDDDDDDFDEWGLEGDEDYV